MNPNNWSRLALWELLQWLLALLGAIPALAISFSIGILIGLNSPGSILIRQERVGQNGKPFFAFKLRTMYVDSDAILKTLLSEDSELIQEWRRYGRLEHDPRVAGCVAIFARRFSIDELPQVLNVICRQMNLVGPRPLPAEIAEKISLRHREIRLNVLPGMTGLWQVSGRSELSIAAMGRLDAIYVRHRTVLRDVIILMRTVCVLINRRGAF